MTKIAKVNFYKDVEQDNYENGCTGDLRSIYFQEIEIPFTTTQDLLKGFFNWLYTRYDVAENEFMQDVNNEIENYRFDYSQNEDSDGKRLTLTEENPDGYYAFYMFLVTEVNEVTEIYEEFEQIGGN